jgi:hypothetical protein
MSLTCWSRPSLNIKGALTLLMHYPTMSRVVAKALFAFDTHICRAQCQISDFVAEIVLYDVSGRDAACVVQQQYTCDARPTQVVYSLPRES